MNSYKKIVYLEDLDLESFVKENQLEAVILDYDGILAGFRSLKIDSEGKRIIETFIDLLPEQHVFVLSNSESRKALRADYFSKNWKKVEYLIAKKKPDPEGIDIVIKRLNIQACKIAVIDDGLLTGILMGIKKDAITLYARRRSLKESFKNRALRISTTYSQLLIFWILYCVSKVLRLKPKQNLF